MSLPLFPLPRVVLLPGLVLPLYIFEPRYRELLARVRASGEPFGITRLLPAEQEGASFESRVARVGTLAHLRGVTDHEDGTASIEVVGGERFEVVSFDSSRSYLSAVVRTLPLPEGDPDVIAALSGKVLEGTLSSEGAGFADLKQRAPHEPLFLATFCAALLPLTSEQRQEVLTAASLSERFELMAAWLPARTLN